MKKVTVKTTEKTLTPAEQKRQAKIQAILNAGQDNEDEDGEMGEEEGEGKIKSILKLYTKGFTRKEIIQAGFNKTTVYRQTGEFNKLKKAPVMDFFGYEMFERRVLRIMASKKISRDKAVELLMSKDAE